MSPLPVDARRQRARAATRLAALALSSTLWLPTSGSAQPKRPLAAAAAVDDHPSVRLVLEAGPDTAGCLSAAELIQATQAQLGRAVFVEGDAPPDTFVRVRFERTSDGFRVTASLESAGDPSQLGDQALGARELVTRDSCRALDEQLVLVVALLADSDSDVSVHPADPTPEPPPFEPPPPEPAEPVSTAPSWEQARRGPWTVALDAGVVAALGVMPGVAWGAELGAGVAPPGWPLLRARVLGFLPGRAQVEPGAGLDFLVGMAGLAVCPELLGGRQPQLRGCFGGDLILRRAESHGLEGSRAATRLTGQGTLALRASVQLAEEWQATASVGAGLVSHLDRFSYRRNGKLERAFEPAFVPLFANLSIAHDFR